MERVLLSLVIACVAWVSPATASEWSGVPALGEGEPGSKAIVTVADHGAPVLPDVQRGAATFGAATNRLTFTFDSPRVPWTPDEVATMEHYIADFYPVLEQIYGPPAFDQVVNIRREHNLAYQATYSLGSNEILLWAGLPVPTPWLCHTMIHAFHDDLIIPLEGFEEMMVRAVEVAAYNALDGWEHWDERHGDRHYDVYYDLYNTPDLTYARGANPQLNVPGVFPELRPEVMLRQQIGGYAWSKPYLENPEFFARFNQGYYALMAIDPTLGWRPERLLAVARAAQPTVEGADFGVWARRQHALNTIAPAGFRIQQRFVDDSPNSCRTVATFFYREPNGPERGQAGVPVQWTILDHEGRLLTASTEWTDAYGNSTWNAEIAADYVGRMTIVASAITPDGYRIADVTYRGHNRTAGLFGVVRDALEGRVSAVHLGSGARESASLTHGCFELPSMGPLAGSFRVTFRYPDGKTSERIVTKDASDYYLIFGREPEVNLAPNGTFESPDLRGWDPYHGSTLSLSGSMSGDQGLLVTGPHAAEQFGINDHPNCVKSVPAAGTTYRFSAWVHSSTPIGTPSTGRRRIRVREYFKGVRVGGSHYSNAVEGVGEWQQLMLEYTARRAGSSLDFQIVQDPADDYVPTATERAAFAVEDISIRPLTAWEAAPTEYSPVEAGVGDADRTGTMANEPALSVHFMASVRPNPGSSALLRYTTTRSGPVRVRVFDVRGRLVATPFESAFAPAGTNHVALERGCAPLAAGVYWYRVDATEGALTGRFVLLK